MNFVALYLYILYLSTYIYILYLCISIYIYIYIVALHILTVDLRLFFLKVLLNMELVMDSQQALVTAWLFLNSSKKRVLSFVFYK